MLIIIISRFFKDYLHTTDDTPDTILHNYWIKRDDGTTATERLFKVKPPDVFEWLLDNMPELALPRKSRKQHYITLSADIIPATYISIFTAKSS